MTGMKKPQAARPRTTAASRSRWARSVWASSARLIAEDASSPWARARRGGLVGPIVLEAPPGSSLAADVGAALTRAIRREAELLRVELEERLLEVRRLDRQVDDRRPGDRPEEWPDVAFEVAGEQAVADHDPGYARDAFERERRTVEPHFDIPLAPREERG